jgi:hypothetical protein
MSDGGQSGNNLVSARSTTNEPISENTISYSLPLEETSTRGTKEQKPAELNARSAETDW